MTCGLLYASACDDLGGTPWLGTQQFRLQAHPVQREGVRSDSGTVIASCEEMMSWDHEARTHAGDQVYVKGYVRDVSPQGVSVRNTTNGEVTLAVGSWKGDSTAASVVPLVIDPTYGSFDHVLRVPSDAQLSGSVTLTLRQADTDLASASVTVADPRPPTAELTMEAPAWVMPDGTLRANITAQSFIGASVADAPMTLAWTVGYASGAISMQLLVCK